MDQLLQNCVLPTASRRYSRLPAYATMEQFVQFMVPMRNRMVLETPHEHIVG